MNQTDFFLKDLKIETIAGAPIQEIHPLKGGKNNQSFLAATTTMKHYVIKRYFRHPLDPRDRLHHEATALQWMNQAKMNQAPIFVSTDESLGLLIYEYVEGTSALASSITNADLSELLTFMNHLHKSRFMTGAKKIPNASEAFFSIQDILENISLRHQRLIHQVPWERVAASMHRELQIILNSIKDLLTQMQKKWSTIPQGSFHSKDLPLPQHLKTLSPSDIGFHNAIRTPSGHLTFIDFEYFGWDDPAKLVSDLLLQPEMRPSQEQAQLFLNESIRIYGSDLEHRLPILFLLFALKWCTILLNEFQPVAMDRRRHAGEPIEERQKLQLDRCHALTKNIEHLFHQDTLDLSNCTKDFYSL